MNDRTSSTTANDAKKTETDFAPAGRAGREVLEDQAREALTNPVIRVMLEAVQGYLLVLNEQRQIVAANPEVLEALGDEDPDWLIGLRPGESLNCRNFSQGPDGCGTGKECRSCGAVLSIMHSQQKEESCSGECTLSIRHGSRTETKYFRVHATPLRSHAHRLTVFSILDISASKQREVLDDVFLHDLLNSVGCMEGLSRTLSETDPQSVMRQLASLVGHLRDEIDFHRSLLEAEKGILAQKAGPVRSAAVLIELEDILKSHPRSSCHCIEFHIEAQGQHQADRVLLIRVLLNMALNAVEASTDGSPVTISYRKDAKNGFFSVHNRGCIPEEAAGRIFERSFSTKARKGRGLGTYGMKLLGEKYLGGVVSYITDSSTGTVFQISIPLVECAETPVLNEALHSSTENPLHLSILFIDDLEPLAKLGKLFLERAGFSVIAKTDPLDALATFEKNPGLFSAVVTDLSMPRSNGLELAARIHKVAPQMPILLCTGHGDHLPPEELQSLGIKAILSKPVVSTELTRIVGQVCGTA